MALTSFAHHQLPPPFDRYASLVLLEEVEHAEYYLLVTIAFLTVLAVIQLKAFARPPPVPLKRLPRRPALSILFKPDDISSIQQGTATTSSTTNGSVHSSRLENHLRSMMTTSLFKGGSSAASVGSEEQEEQGQQGQEQDQEEQQEHIQQTVEKVMDAAIDAFTSNGHRPRSSFSSSIPGTPGVSVNGTGTTSEEPEPTPAETPFAHTHDLPDSFAPLLSSSQTELLLHHLTADLIHGIHVEGGIRMQTGRHEIPLDKDSSRPQLVMQVPKGGCRISVVAGIGSDGFSSAQDLDVTLPTCQRSRPMLKHAGLVLDPPLPLSNVAPTLIHFPTLFEDNFVPTLRRIQIFRFFVDAIISISSLIEKVLWIIESVLQIHLSKVRVTPLYKGRAEGDSTSPEWRLTLAFSGHVLLCGWIPIPFISVILPTFIIPQPHALLEYLMTNQPLASARLRRENIAEQRIALAVLDTVDTWNTSVSVVATPPAVGIDLTLPGGVSLGLEMMHGRDPTAGRSRQDGADPSVNKNKTPSVPPFSPNHVPSSSGASMSSWTTNNDGSGGNYASARRLAATQAFDANDLVPWKLEISAKGTMDKEKMTVHLTKFSVKHEDPSSPIPAKSNISTRGSLAIWKVNSAQTAANSKAAVIRRNKSFVHRAALAGTTDAPSVAAILFFSDENESFPRENRMLQYDYAFDISEDSKLDAMTFSVGASHPMLNGGNMVTTILESIYAFGSVTAREHATLDPIERRRKRNILRHLPAVDFTFGIQNSYIPPESLSYTDDGQTKTLPEMEGGRMTVRFLGGIEEGRQTSGGSVSSSSEMPVSDGIKVVADFGFSSIAMNSESRVKEFPELEIFEGTKLRNLTAGRLSGSIKCHLRPQQLASKVSTTGPNIFNPLEAYEIDFSNSSLSARIKESTTSLGHRRIIIPTETTVVIKVVESIVDMALEGKTQCELSWDFQGLSPILQVTEVGLSPEDVMHENKEQVSLLIAPLRQGRLNFHVSPVGGINITKAVTSREDKEGLYDWKFFNAIVSPDQESAARLMDVIHDKRTMNKLLQVIKLVNADAHGLLRYILTQVWRAKEILDQEGVSDPAHVIPSYRMARLISLFLCGDTSEVDEILPFIRRVVAGDGLDTVKIKELLRQHSEAYDEWAPEIDRGVRWLETMFTPFAVPQPYVEKQVIPLSEMKHYAARFKYIPSAAHLYEQIHDKPHLPLDPDFSHLVSRVAPFLNFTQIEYFLKVRASTDWQPSDLQRIRYVYSVKRKAMEISESYGGLSFLPQSFLVSVFLGEATRASLRVQQRKRGRKHSQNEVQPPNLNISTKPSTLVSLRQRRSRLQNPYPPGVTADGSNVQLTPAGQVASLSNFMLPDKVSMDGTESADLELLVDGHDQYELGDCLLGPADVAILLQAGLTSVMKGSSVVQLNQRMLLDLVATQPKTFAIAVLAEIGTPGGQGSPRGLASALMALLELDQNSFRPVHRLDMQALLESWLPGLKVPKRADYMAGGRWARQSYYDSLFSLATSILEDAECYMALKGHIQRVRRHKESDPLPQPRGEPDGTPDSAASDDQQSSTLKNAIALAKAKIEEADSKGQEVVTLLLADDAAARTSPEYADAIDKYRQAFSACARVRALDKLSFHAPWFRDFYRRNYDALMIKSMHDNVLQDVDSVRYWLHALRYGAKFGAPKRQDGTHGNDSAAKPGVKNAVDRIFLEPEESTEQVIVDAIIDATIYYEKEREQLRQDPLVRLLIPNPPGKYNFTIVTAMGVITDGKAGLELQSALQRLEKKRGVRTIRADTATARSFEYNASKIIDAIEATKELKTPFGLIGYSQGCANALMAETNLLSGTPAQQEEISSPQTGLVCRQLLFSAANGSRHGPASDKKMQRAIVMIEEFFKHQQGYVSRALQSTFLEVITNFMDSAQFQRLMGGAQTFMSDGARVFWREAQHLSHVPTCTLRGVLEEHTTPEFLEMIANMLTKQAGSALHDSQVHVFDAIGHPVYHNNRNARVLERCDVGQGAIQRTHHWSPLRDEVSFVATQRDAEMASFECAKDRHVFPWVDVNVRFGFVQYAEPDETDTKTEAGDHCPLPPTKLHTD